MKTDDGATRGGLRGRMDRLHQTYLEKAQALQVAIAILDAEDRATAQALAPKKFAQALQHRNGAEATRPTAKRAKRRVSRHSADDRRAELTAYLRKHDGQNTQQIAKGLGWKDKQVWKFGPQVATSIKSQDRGGPMTWHLGTLRASKKTAKARVKAKKKLVVRPRAAWLQDIRTYLADHPEAYTVEIAKAVRRKPNSGFVKLVREVARPARATTATQAIPWVLTEA